MYCRHCGKEVTNENDFFCTKCGQPLTDKAKTPDNKISEQIGNIDINTLINTINSKLLSIGMHKKDLIAFCTLILSGIMLFTDTLKIGVWGINKTETIFGLIENNTALLIIFAVLYIMSILFVAYNCWKKREFSKINIVLNALTSFATTILLIAVIIYGKNEAGDYGADFGFTFSGVILLISAVITLLLSVLSFRKKIRHNSYIDFICDDYPHHKPQGMEEYYVNEEDDKIKKYFNTDLEE